MAGIQSRRRTATNPKKPHISQLRISANVANAIQQKRQEYAFSEYGSFTEGDIHIGRNGVSIAQSPKSPNVEEFFQKDELEIYEDRVLGHGAFGVVKLAHYKQTDSIVAVKKVPLNLEPGIRKKVLTELRTLYQCNHPNIVSFIGGFLQDGAVNLVLEYMDGGTILQFLATRKIMPEFVVGKIASLLLPALAYIHKEIHIVHRDIKPANILIDSKGNVKLSDFGVSGKLANTLGAATTFAGTLTYMSPERIKGDPHTTCSDIWSFGLSLLECAQGYFPFLPPGDKSTITFFDLLERIQNLEISTRVNGYSPEFSSFIKLCLVKNPEERPSAVELLEHAWIKRYSNEPEIHLKRWIHQTLKMQEKPFFCGEDCGECSGAY